MKGTSPQTEDVVLLTPTISIPMNYQEFQSKYPSLSVKNGQPGYELLPQQHLIITNNTTVAMTAEPTKELEDTLFHIYFAFVHPAYPLLFKQCILDIHSKDKYLLSHSLRYAIMSLSSIYHNNEYSMAFYQLAKDHINIASPELLSIRLDTVQTLLLLYKYTEIAFITPDVRYLELAKVILKQLNSSLMFQQQEMINRARWILFASVGLSNLSDPGFNKLYSEIDLPTHLPQPLKEEHNEDAFWNKFSQVLNLSVLYSHTIQSIITGASDIDIHQFMSMRQHWYDSLNPSAQSALICENGQVIDILPLYTAIIYDMLYLLLLLHQQHQIKRGITIETAYRLQRMIYKWVTHAQFISAIQSKRMAVFGLLLCLQVYIIANIFDCIENIRLVMKHIQYIDPKIDQQLNELTRQLTIGRIRTPNSPLEEDYFSLIPMHSTCSSPSLSTPLFVNQNTSPLAKDELDILLQEQLQQLQIKPVCYFNSNNNANKS